MTAAVLLTAAHDGLGQDYSYEVAGVSVQAVPTGDRFIARLKEERLLATFLSNLSSHSIEFVDSVRVKEDLFLAVKCSSISDLHLRNLKSLPEVSFVSPIFGGPKGPAFTVVK
jgi:hypothetical protein